MIFLKCSRVERKFVYFYEQTKLSVCFHTEVVYHIVGKRLKSNG